MKRSLAVRQNCITKVKQAVKRNGYPRQKDLAEDLGFCLATINNFLNGRPVDHINFEEISHKLQLDWQEIAFFEDFNQQLNHLVQTQDLTLISDDYSDIDESLIYVERPEIESICYEALLNSGGLVRIKAPCLMGKTTFVSQVLARLKTDHYLVAYLNLHLADLEDFSNLNNFLKWFCVSVSQSLGLSNQISTYWDERFSTSKMNSTVYFEEYILASSTTPIVLCLDEVDRIFPHRNVASEFLGILRAWHEQAKVRNIWKKLRLVVIHSTEVYIPLNINESPFNVGVSIELPEFNVHQVSALAQSYKLSWTDSMIGRLMEMVGGHPHLVQTAFSQLSTSDEASFDAFLQTATTEAGIYGNHLRHYWYGIQKDSELVEALKKVITTNTGVELTPKQNYQLHSMGLVKLQGNKAISRYRLYEEYFRNCFKRVEQT